MEVPTDDRLIPQWIENQPVAEQKLLAEQKLEEYFSLAAQPRHASGNACIKLCYFVQQCLQSKTQCLQDVALSSSTCLSLFNFYLEWNEKNQNRSMRQVLELVSTLISKDNGNAFSSLVKSTILGRTLSIILHRGAQPLVKPAFKSLESFLTRGTISTTELIQSFQFLESEYNPIEKDINGENWNSLIQIIFEWMVLQEISPAAGKFLVTIFRELRSHDAAKGVSENKTASWQSWIRRGLERYPDCLENVKNYLFPPLFKIDRAGSLLLLQELNSTTLLSSSSDENLDSLSLLRLVAIEAGKKSGLVEDPDFIRFQKPPRRKMASIVLEESLIEPLLVHPLSMVRCLAFSVAINSSSSIRPFTTVTFHQLRSCLGVLYSDTDAKFRNDILSNTKHLIERLHGAISFLTREIDILRQKLSKEDDGVSTYQLNAMTELRLQHVHFLEWFVEFLTEELVPTASYQRHITALKASHLLFRSDIPASDVQTSASKIPSTVTILPFPTLFFTASRTRLLLDLLLDPFEDVRSIAADLLKLAPPGTFSENNFRVNNFETRRRSHATNNDDTNRNEEPVTENGAIDQSIHLNQVLDEFLGRAVKIALKSGRADYADGVARTYELIYGLLDDSQKSQFVRTLIAELESNIRLAENDLSEAVHAAPVHGLFAALNLILASYKNSRNTATEQAYSIIFETQTLIVDMCSRIWIAVKDVLCNDSPEGHLPQELEEADSIDTKDILSYSFRAIHESSNLLRTIASFICVKSKDEFSMIATDVFARIGYLSFEQLSTLRHRGAFSTVSLTFSRVCQLSQSLPKNSSPNEEQFLTKFYEDALECIAEQTSTTRRSAGIPALIAGILSSNTKNPSFQEVVTKLKHLASLSVKLSEKDNTNLPQVHAMNCLREIFKSSILGKRAEPHVADGLKIASDSLLSDIWAIRNCGLLLLRSLVDCLFGTSESKEVMEAGWDGRSTKLSYDKYPALPELLLKLLDIHKDEDGILMTQIGVVESVFPALDIIRRAGPPPIIRDQIYNGVCQHLGNKVWHIRELAARTVSNLLLHDEWFEELKALFNQCSGTVNKAHGTLMAIKFTIERRLTVYPDSITVVLPELIKYLQQSEAVVSVAHTCSYVQAVWIELHNVLTGIVLSSPRSEVTDLFIIPSADNTAIVLQRQLSLALPDSLLQLAILRQGIHATGLCTDSIGLWRMLKVVAQQSPDLTLAALDYLPEAWQPSVVNMLPLSNAYIQIVEFCTSPQVKAAAAVKLSELLDHYFDVSLDAHKGQLFELDSIPGLLSSEGEGPQSSNAELLLSGWLNVRHFLHDTVDEESLSELSQRMLSWGGSLRAAGHARNDFDTRFSAVSALRSFFLLARLTIRTDHEFMLPSLFALYDALNDDDDEIRDLAAEAVSALLGQSCVSLAAQPKFLTWIASSYAASSTLVAEVVLRLTGNAERCTDGLNLIPATNQLVDSMREDNSLFIEEEQNLFIDEIRELKQWTRIFLNISPKLLFCKHSQLADTEPITSIARWTLAGLQKLRSLDVIDGPLGKLSKPAVYIVCARVITCASIVLGFSEVVGELLQGLFEPIRVELGVVKDIEGLHPLLLALAGHKSLV